jgi:sugar phosphate isomerase/epimerase
MQLKVYKALWGMAGSLESQMDGIAQAGYDGIETGLPIEGAADFRKMLDERSLDYIGMLFLTEAEPLLEGLQTAEAAGARQVTLHSGKDSMTFDEGCRYLEAALRAEEKSGIVVGHETHRGRLFYNPWVTAEYLKKFPELKIVADFSHWTNVCESMLDDQKENVSLACRHAVHIHGRVGFEEGPQVSDPRAPEFQPYVEKFETWWDDILAAHQDRGASVVSFDPEFGPPRYLQTLPYTGVPVADLWDICLYMATRMRGRWHSLAPQK